MTTDVWRECRGEEAIKPLNFNAYRIVESQEQIATANLVDTLEEQAVLEGLLEQTKPPQPTKTHKHYLLTTPFRYPPLKHGSRFGTRSKRSLFYASMTVATALAETAYYRFVFLDGMEAPWNGRLLTEHSSFLTRVATVRGVELNQPPFSQFEHVLASPSDYIATQVLGQRMRDADIGAFHFKSARDLKGGVNAGVFQVGSIRSKLPQNMQQWLCATTGDEIVLQQSRYRNNIFRFSFTEFCVDGRLPQPAF